MSPDERAAGRRRPIQLREPRFRRSYELPGAPTPWQTPSRGILRGGKRGKLLLNQEFVKVHAAAECDLRRARRRRTGPYCKVKAGRRADAVRAGSSLARLEALWVEKCALR